MKKRFISLACVCSILSSMLFISPSASAAVNADGTLSWDFETNQDVSYLTDIKKYTARDVDTFPSGAWNTQVKNTLTVQSLAPHRVQFGNIGRSIWGIVSNSDDYGDASCKKTNHTPGGVPLSNGGTYCAVISNVEGTSRPEVLGMTVQLRDNQIDVGRKYRLEFDVLASYYQYTDGTVEDLHRAVWAGFGKPSERITVYNEIPKWLVNATRVNVDTSAEDVDDNMAKGSKWLHATCEITADELQFENGATAFYIGVNKQGEEMQAAEKVYFDNITLTPLEEQKNTIKTTYGYLWNLEEGISGWTLSSGTRLAHKKMTDIYANYSAQAKDSTYGMMIVGTNTEIGAGVGIDNCVAGEYQLCFYATSDSRDIEFYAGEKGNEIKAGDGGPYWGYYSVPVSVSSDGALNLNIYAKSKTSGTSITNVYLDDVRLVYTGADLLIEKGKKIPFFNEVKKKSDEPIMAISALYDGNRLVSANVQEGNAGETYFSQDCGTDVPSDITNPKIRVFLWNPETISPYNNSYHIGKAYTEQTASENISSYYAMWNYDKTAVEVTFDEEASNNNSSWYSAEIYNGGTLIEKVNGRTSLRIDSPSVSGATIKLLKYNRENSVAEVIDTYAWTDFVNKVSEAIPTVTHKKMLTRTAFEKETFERLTLSTMADYDSTDEVTAHSGRYSMKIFNRMGEWTLPVINIDIAKLSATATLNVSCYVRKDPAESETWFAIQHVIPTTTETSWKYYNTQTITDNNWHLLEATINLSDYALAADGEVSIRISTGSTGRPTTYKDSFYLDDFMIVSDQYSGEFYDDMHPINLPRDSSLSATSITPSGKYLELQDDIPVLKDVYKDYFKVGATTWMNYINGKDNPRFGQLVPKHFNSITDNGSFKVTSILNSGDRITYDFSQADATMKFAMDNGIDDIVGHTLISESLDSENNTLSGLDRSGAISFMKEYITKVIKHFEGDGDASEYSTGADYSNWHVSAWDVINEAVLNVKWLETTIEYRDTGNSWYNLIGSDYLKYAFQYADQVCDDNGYDIDLRYNDYGEQSDTHQKAVMKSVNSLKNAGCRIDTIGSQCHLYSDTDPELLKAGWQKFISTGAKLDITEIDVSPYTESEGTSLDLLKYENGIPKDKELAQADLYYELFQILRDYKDDIDRVTFWTYYDGISWWNDRGIKHTDYAGIFDRNYQAKPQFWAIADPEYYQQYYKSDEYLTAN